jgi:hypothetical protein
MRGANFEIVEQTPQAITLRDLGPWDKYLTTTNAAEQIVEDLSRKGLLKEGQKLLYYDSENELTELVHKDGTFVRFAPT